MSPTTPAGTGSGEATLDLIRIFVFLLGASALVTILARRINLPYTVALVGFGIVVGAAVQPLRIEITPQLVLVVLLPALIFEASLRTDLVKLRSSLVGVGLLAGPGVFVSAAVIAAALRLGAGLPWTEAFVVGAMLSATDPAAVIATFRRLDSPRRLATLVEAESVFNDGTGIVVFALAVDFVSRPVGPLEVAASFVSVVAMSSLLGCVAGYVTSRLLPHVGDHLIEISLSVVLAYGVYLIADALGQSGVIATATAGIVLGNYGRSHGLSPVTEEALATVWDFIAYLATAFVFLVVGFAIAVHSPTAVATPIVWAIVATLLGRAVIVYLLLGGWRVARETAGRRGRGESIVSTDNQMPVQWLHVIWWAGLRGAVSTALALSLPSSFPDRENLQAIVFGVVLFTLIVQATTAELAVQRWGVSDPAAPVEAPASEDRGESATADAREGRPVTGDRPERSQAPEAVQGPARPEAPACEPASGPARASGSHVESAE